MLLLSGKPACACQGQGLRKGSARQAFAPHGAKEHLCPHPTAAWVWGDKPGRCWANSCQVRGGGGRRGATFVPIQPHLVPLGTSSSQGPWTHGNNAKRGSKGVQGWRQARSSQCLPISPSHQFRSPSAAPLPAPHSGHPSCPYCQPVWPPGAPCLHTNTETLQALSP